MLACATAGLQFEMRTLSAYMEVRSVFTLTYHASQRSKTKNINKCGGSQDYHFLIAPVPGGIRFPFGIIVLISCGVLIVQTLFYNQNYG